MSKTASLHYDLCCEGAKWLHKQKWNYERCRKKSCYRTEACGACKKYNYVAVELCTWNSENTDVWGLGNFNDSAVIEVKVSHSDFKADQKKWCRSNVAEINGRQAGRLRWYLCPEGVINKDELPEIYRTGQGKVRVRGKVEVEQLKGGKVNLDRESSGIRQLNNRPVCQAQRSVGRNSAK